jgi:hypothetical protein
VVETDVGMPTAASMSESVSLPDRDFARSDLTHDEMNVFYLTILQME